MRITREEVQRVAVLARLALTPEEEHSLVDHFDKILSHMDTLNRLETTHIEPTAHVVSVSSPLRDDRITNAPNPDALLANAPVREGDFFKVPKIIE